MVKIGPSLLHVGDWREGSSGGRGRTTAQSTDHTGFLRGSACCPLPGRLLPPWFSCCLQLRSGAASPLQWSPSLPGSAALKDGLLNSGKSPKWKAGWWFQYFSKRDFQVKDFCFAQKAVPLAFQIPLLIPQFLQQYPPQEENKVTGRTEIGFQGCICHTSHTGSLPTSPQALEGRLSLSGTENFLSGRKVVHQVVWEL